MLFARCCSVELSLRSRSVLCVEIVKQNEKDSSRPSINPHNLISIAAAVYLISSLLGMIIYNSFGESITQISAVVCRPVQEKIIDFKGLPWHLLCPPQSLESERITQNSDKLQWSEQIY